MGCDIHLAAEVFLWTPDGMDGAWKRIVRSKPVYSDYFKEGIAESGRLRPYYRLVERTEAGRFTSARWSG